MLVNKSKLFLLAISASIFLLILVPAHAFFSEEPKIDETPDIELTVAAASALRPAFEAVAVRFQEKTGVKVVLVFSSSGNLARQISHGAPIDLFASADTGYVEELIEEGHLLAETKEVYANGRIVLASNRNFAVEPTCLEDLLSEEVDRIALANPSYAPYGVAAKEAMVGAGIWESVQDKLIYADTVFQALQYVQSGNASVGIIAEAIANVPEVSSVPLQGGLYNPVEHTLAVATAASYPEAAVNLAGFIGGSEGVAIMEEHGFYNPAP